MNRPSPRGHGCDVIGELLDEAADLTMRHLSDRSGLSVSAGSLLNRVSHDGPTRLTALATKEGVSQPSMTQLIQRLERHGIVSRRTDPDDGRAALVAITEAGQALLDERTDSRRDRLAALMTTLTSEEELALWLAAQVALPILHRLVTNAQSPDLKSGSGSDGCSPGAVDARDGTTG